MSKSKVPFIKPGFPNVNDVAADYAKILQANWFTNFGPFEKEFSAQIASYFGEGYYACTASSATSALLASIMGVLGHGDDSKYVLMPSFTFVAGAAALIWCGYKPLFVDIEKTGLHMDIEATKTALDDPAYSDKIAGILFCNAFGVGTIDIEAWETLAEQSKLPLIIDSAAGFGSRYSGERRVGSAGLCEIFSFHATKPFAIGEGGAIVSRDKALIETFESLQNFGFQGRNATRLGFNGKLQEINAAIGLRQFAKFDEILASRQAVFARYQQELNSERFRMQTNAEHASLCFAAVVVQEPGKRDEYLARLQNAGVEARAYYSPSVHKQDYFQTSDKYGELPVTEEIDAAILSLPIHDNMAEDDIELVIQTLNS